MNIRLTWHDGNQVWSKVVGKRLSKAGDRLVQAQWYFTANKTESEALAAARKAEWRKMAKAWAGHRSFLEVMGDDPFPTIPHWYDRRGKSFRAAADHPDAEEIEAAQRANEPTPSDVAEMYGDITVAECAALFMEHRKKRVGADFSEYTNKSFKTDLDRAIKVMRGVRMVDLTPALLDDQRLEIIRRRVSPNTATNYGRAMKMLVEWYYDSPYSTGLTMPKGISAVFSAYPKRRPAKPRYLSMDELRTVMRVATDRRRLYMLLMLNTGMQPTDIPALLTTSFDLNASLVRWCRQKNERLRNPSQHEITSHLWPETVAVVRTLLSPQSGPAFVNINGKPLSHDSATGNRQNAVSKALVKFFQKVRRDHGVSVSAKNFRQTGGLLVHEHTGDYGLCRIWLGRKFDKVDRSYLTGVYHQLNSASMAIREKLLAANVLVAASTPSCRQSPNEAA